MADETTPTAAREPVRTGVPGLLEQLGKIRDGLLVLISIVYLLGYVVWSIVSWRNGMGPLPLLDAQYLIAGVAPALVLTAAVSAIWILRTLLMVRWPSWLATQRTWIVVSVHAILLAIACLGYFIVLRTPTTIPSRNTLLLGGPMLVIPALLMEPVLMSSRLLDAARARLERIDPRQAKLVDSYQRLIAGLEAALGLSGNRWLAIIVFPTIAAFVVLRSYVDLGYTSLPQSLGGAAPRCAYLDVAAENVSSQTLDQLGVPADTLRRKGNVRTGPLLVYFSGSAALMVRNRNHAARTDPLVELSRDGVKAISWCDASE